MDRPNILLVMWHDLGTYLGTYGFQPSPSPNLDRLSSEENPFFLTLNTNAVHRPFGDEHDPGIAKVLEVPPWMADDECNRADLACFHRYVKDADDQFGEVFAALDAAELSDNTLVIFTTDHGMPFARAKHSQYDPGLRISLVAKWPDHIEPGASRTELLSNLDFMPTLLELVGLPMPESNIALHGRSFAPLLTDSRDTGDRSYTPRREVYAEHTYGVMYSPSRTIRTERHKYIAHFEPRAPIMHEPFVVHRCGEER